MTNDTHIFSPVDLDLSRSTFHFSPTVSGTCMAGRLIPAYAFEVLPGDSIKMDCHSLFKMSTPVYPTMDVLFGDVAFYFVPNRLILSRRYGTPDLSDSIYSWEAFIGAQDNLLNMPIPANGLELPTLRHGGNSVNGSILDHLGIRSSNHQSYNKFLNALPVMGYYAIWNENYRDENTMEPVTWTISSGGKLNVYNSTLVYFNQGEMAVKGVSIAPNLYAWYDPTAHVDSGGSTVTTDSNYWMPQPTCIFHSYLGSLLPWPQRNLNGVPIPLDGLAPVDGVGSGLTSLHGKDTLVLNDDAVGFASGNHSLYLAGGSGAVEFDSASYSPTNPKLVKYSNLYADLSSAVNANVNALRAAVQLQRWYEKLARSGNRYDELEYGLFGVRPHDSGFNRPVYLGGKRIPLRIEMVASTNGDTTSGDSHGYGSLGQLGAFSHTNDSDKYFYHSFDDFGWLMCVFTIRSHNTFSDALPRKWTRSKREDYYFPTFARLGDQPVYDFELDADNGTNVVLGYSPAWEEYRYEHDIVTGQLRTGGSLSFMTYTDTYPNFSLAQWVNASYQIKAIDKTLKVSSQAALFQFVYQFTFDFTLRRCMPTYSIPGLLDHF